ncbi:MAG: tRNA (guanosine(37)-N1)-methyltransferase TrmD [Deltaproteobacteria bacterium]|nr:tRNA (guanosine(37)-N1)-methyltransferase TrmD [Deltaproteobacteria bacterium]
MREGLENTYVFHVLTLFPDLIREAVGHSVLGRAIKSGIVDVRVWDIRDYAHDRHRTVDDVPYGGGPGMVMKVEPVVECLSAVREVADPGVPSILMSAAGPAFTQSAAEELAGKKGAILVCGHYEGVDERVAQHYVDREMSVGDYVLSGGEFGALVVVDAVARLVPGVLGNSGSLEMESHQTGLLEYPQYTRPSLFDGHRVPDVLLSGNHAEIEKFRKRKAIEKTRINRPDLFRRLSGKDLEQQDAPPPRLGRPVRGVQEQVESVEGE